LTTFTEKGVVGLNKGQSKFDLISQIKSFGNIRMLERMDKYVQGSVLGHNP